MFGISYQNSSVQQSTFSHLHFPKLMNCSEKCSERFSTNFFQLFFFAEGTSDASDTEQRLKALESELRKRRSELQKLRKKKEKDKLRQKEQELRRELQVT